MSSEGQKQKSQVPKITGGLSQPDFFKLRLGPIAEPPSIIIPKTGIESRKEKGPGTSRSRIDLLYQEALDLGHPEAMGAVFDMGREAAASSNVKDKEMVSERFERIATNGYVPLPVALSAIGETGRLRDEETLIRMWVRAPAGSSNLRAERIRGAVEAELRNLGAEEALQRLELVEQITDEIRAPLNRPGQSFGYLVEQLIELGGRSELVHIALSTYIFSAVKTIVEALERTGAREQLEQICGDSLNSKNLAYHAARDALKRMGVES